MNDNFMKEKPVYLSASGIVQGMRPLVGYNYGAGERKRQCLPPIRRL